MTQLGSHHFFKLCNNPLLTSIVHNGRPWFSNKGADRDIEMKLKKISSIYNYNITKPIR